MAEALWNRSPKKFWQNIRKSKTSWLPSTVGGETGNKAVTVMWRKHFCSIAELIKKLWNWQFRATKYNLTCKGVSTGGKGGTIPRASNSYGGAESLQGRPIIVRVPKSPNNVTSTLFNTIYLLPKDLRFEHGAPNLLLTPGAILPRYSPASLHQVSHCVRTFDAVLRDSLYRFFIRCASSSNFFIRSLQKSDAFYKSSFFLNYSTPCMVETKCSSCSWIVSVFASHQYCFCVVKICGHCVHTKH